MEHVLTYWNNEDDCEHVVYCQTKEEAEEKANALEGVDEEDISIMTREEYDEFELRLLDMAL